MEESAQTATKKPKKSELPYVKRKGNALFFYSKHPGAPHTIAISQMLKLIKAKRMYHYLNERENIDAWKDSRRGVGK